MFFSIIIFFRQIIIHYRHFGRKIRHLIESNQWKTVLMHSLSSAKHNEKHVVEEFHRQRSRSK
jgi:hypothetical protein